MLVIGNSKNSYNALLEEVASLVIGTNKTALLEWGICMVVGVFVIHEYYPTAYSVTGT